MNIGGPFLDRARRGAKKKWYLSYFVPKLENGVPVVVDGKPVNVRRRPYYATQDEAREDKPRILAQHHSSGAGAGGVLTREQVADFERATAIAPEVSHEELAKFWRLHHPLGEVRTLRQHLEPFLADTLARLGKTHQARDLKFRVGAFVRKFGDRKPETFTRAEAFHYLKTSLTEAKLSGRTIRNHKAALCTFFNYLMSEEVGAVKVNPFAGIKKRQLPREQKKEITFLPRELVERYLRAAERYDPELVAHEVIQLFSGVRADDEMASFRGEWVMPETREIVIPAAAAKMDTRAVINSLEENFWAWWRVYGRKGSLRPKSYKKRWYRLRTLVACDPEQADELARLPLHTLGKRPEAAAARKAWPWNARRRTFCTYHVAKYQSADRTALILRQIGGTETLHNSYRGLGVTQSEGERYFEIQPRKVTTPVLFDRSRARTVVAFAADGQSRSDSRAAS
jgi:integrase